MHLRRFARLVPGNTDERLASECAFYRVNACNILADMGFWGTTWQATIAQDTRNCVLTPKRANQTAQNTLELDGHLNDLRERIEGVFYQLQNIGRNPERLLTKTVFDRTARITLKVICPYSDAYSSTTSSLTSKPFRFHIKRTTTNYTYQ